MKQRKITHKGWIKMNERTSFRKVTYKMRFKSNLTKTYYIIRVCVCVQILKHTLALTLKLKTFFFLFHHFQISFLLESIFPCAKKKVRCGTSFWFWYICLAFVSGCDSRRETEKESTSKSKPVHFFSYFILFYSIGVYQFLLIYLWW